MCVSYFFFNFYFRFLAAASWPHGAGKLGKSQRAHKNSAQGQKRIASRVEKVSLVEFETEQKSIGMEIAAKGQ